MAPYGSQAATLPATCCQGLLVLADRLKICYSKYIQQTKQVFFNQNNSWNQSRWDFRFVEFVACIINIHIFTIFANTIAHCPMPIARAHCCPPQTHLVSSINYIRYKIIHSAQFFALLTILFKKPVRVHQGYMNSCGREWIPSPLHY